MLYPSLDEGFGLPVAEALMCGTPVILSNVESMRELPHTQSTNVHFIDPTSPSQLLEAIRLLQRTSVDKCAIAKAARSGFHLWGQLAIALELTLSHTRESCELFGRCCV